MHQRWGLPPHPPATLSNFITPPSPAGLPAPPPAGQTAGAGGQAWRAAAATPRLPPAGSQARSPSQASDPASPRQPPTARSQEPLQGTCVPQGAPGALGHREWAALQKVHEKSACGGSQASRPPGKTSSHTTAQSESRAGDAALIGQTKRARPGPCRRRPGPRHRRGGGGDRPQARGSSARCWSGPGSRDSSSAKCLSENLGKRQETQVATGFVGRSRGCSTVT